jgi:hypothetical protein
MKKLLGCVVAFVALSTILPQARAEFIIDQSQNSFDVLFNLRFSGTTGQAFTPALQSLDVVEVLFDGPGGTFASNIPGEFSVSIHRGGVTGVIVATSFSVTLLTGIFREVVRFEFPISVSLVPSDIYTIEINRLSDPDLPFFIGAIRADAYAGGTAIIDGQSQADLDLFFREGPHSAALSVPGTLSLYGLGALLLVAYRWHRGRKEQLGKTRREGSRAITPTEALSGGKRNTAYWPFIAARCRSASPPSPTGSARRG